MEQHSCETLNVMMTDNALEVMDSKSLTFVVLLDLSKTFDSLDHSRLLEKLKTLGVRSTGLEGFRRYLFGRKQYVSIGAEVSSLGAFSHGVHPRSAPHFLFTMHAVWSSRLILMMIYRRSRLGAVGIVS